MLNGAIAAGAVGLAMTMAVRSVLAPVPEATGVVLVIAAPWGPSPQSVIAAAGGHPVGPATALFGVLATFDYPVSSSALRAGGAWGVYDGQAIANLCGVGT